MATLEQTIQIETSVLGEVVRRIGDKNLPTDLTIDGQVFDTGNFPVTDNFGNVTVWQANMGGLASFRYAFFLSDVDCWVEFANTTPNPDERAMFFCPAGAVLCLPSLYIGAYASNTSRLDGAALVLATDYNLISEVRVGRDAADLAGDATCRLVLIK